MPVGWFYAPYGRQDPPVGVGRYCTIEDARGMIAADSGRYAYLEVLGGYGLCKVRASAATLQAINALAGVTRLPKDALDQSLSDLTNAQKNSLRNFITGTLGYTAAEVNARFPGDLGGYTLGDVVRFTATRRLRPVVAAGAISLTGPVDKPENPDVIDRQVP